jgi:GDPmannose 4,6-dehydratase
MRRAFITGITGQDGSYLAELLLAKGYEVHGLVRRSSSFNTGRIDHLYRDEHEIVDGRPALHLHYGDMLDEASLVRLVDTIRPHEVYNLAAQSHVRVSFDLPVFTVQTAGLGALHLLEAVRQVDPQGIRVYQAGSSEMFGSAAPPQSEVTPFHPRSPYACAKVFAHHQAVNYREAYGMFVANGILFNHESPRRGETFLTRKVTRAVGRIAEGLQRDLYLGHLDARRDWGYAADYVRAMWMMLQHGAPGDYVVATGTSWSVREWVDRAFALADLDPSEHVRFDPRYVRPAEVDHLLGDPTHIEATLGWRPEVDFDELVRRMVEHDRRLARRERRMAETDDPPGDVSGAARG